jgi:tetratricopeptide (TPR) repeat protein
MFLGVVLFLTLIVAFFYQLTHRRSLKALPVFFLFPIAMIGYPSIQSIQYKDGVVTIDKATRELQSRPTDVALRKTLQNQVAQIARRPTSNANDVAVLAKAQYALGDEAAAKSNLRKALSLDPKAPDALELQHKIIVVDELSRLASEAQTNPAAKGELQTTLAEASRLHIASPIALIKVAQAEAVLGEQQKALETINKAAAINPFLANPLRQSIRARIAPEASATTAP